MEKKILSSALVDAIGARKIRHLLFTTYSFEPDFFELEILSDLFDRSFSQDPAVRRVQMSFVLREVAGIEVYYDETVFDSITSSRLDLARIPLRARNAAFHPKVTLVLVENEDSSDSLVVMSGSANLTRAGWWENIECAHIESCNAGAKSGLREGLLAFLERLRRLDKSRSDGERPAWIAIHDFVKKLETDVRKHPSTSFYPTSSANSFISFLRERVGRHRSPWKMEIISPFFANDASNSLHEEIASELNVSQIRLLLPCDDKNQALCAKEYYEAITADKTVHWSRFEDRTLSPSEKGAVYRKLHAKVYRIYSKEIGEEWIFTGSVNFTKMAFGRKNVESGFLIKMLEPYYRPMLVPIDDDAEVLFAPAEKLEKAPGGSAFPLLLLRYNWASKEFSAWSESPGPVTAKDSSGLPVGTIPALNAEEWQPAQDVDVDRLENSLRNSSLITVEFPGTGVTKIMVQETAMNNKPSPITALSPRQILELWATLDPEKRLNLLGALAMEKLLPLQVSPQFYEKASGTDVSSFFSQFSEIFQSFMRLRQHLDNALKSQSRKEFDYYLYGQDIDSLPSLLTTVIGSGDFDAVLKFIIGLCAKQLLLRFAPGGCSGKSGELATASHAANLLPADALSEKIEALLQLKETIKLPDFPKRPEEFFDWFEEMFLQWAGEESAA